MLFLINLEAADERRRHMVTQLDALGLEFSRIGFDGRDRPREAIYAWCRENFGSVEFDADRLSGAEMGCWLSHLTAWDRLRGERHAVACAVIEDDIRLAPQFAEVVAELSRAPVHDLVYLGTSSRNISSRRRTRIGDCWVHEPVGTVFNTWGYVISRAYVERFFAAPTRIRMPIDHFLGGSARQSRPRVGVLQPPLVVEDLALGRRSQIEQYTSRPDRWRVLAAARRRLLASRVGDFYFSIYRWL